MRYLIAAVFLLAACSGPQSRVKDGRLLQTLDQRPSRSKYIEALGIGAADPSLPSETQRRALSRDAAIAKAQYELLSQLKGVKLSGGVTVELAMAKSSELSARVHDALRGAEVLKSEYTKDDGCVVTMRLPREALAALEKEAPLRPAVRGDGAAAGGARRALGPGRSDPDTVVTVASEAARPVPGLRDSSLRSARARVTLRAERSGELLAEETRAASALGPDGDSAKDAALERAGYEAGLALAAALSGR